MTAAVQEAVQEAEAGCYALKGTNFETRLVGAITDAIIDSDRYVREGVHGDNGWNNGLPNWAMYRTALAGDTHLAVNLRAWCEAFGMAYVEAGGARKGGDALGVCIGRDAYVRLTTTRWGAPADELAPLLGITPKTYRTHRAEVYARLKVSLDEYWMRLEIAMRQVAIRERRQKVTAEAPRWRDGRGFGDETEASMMLGDGNLRAMQKYIE